MITAKKVCRYFIEFIVKTKQKHVVGFFTNLSLLFVIRAVSFLFLIGAMAIATRRVGIVAMGKYSTINSLALFLLIPMLLGLNNSIARYLPVSNKSDEDLIKGSAIVGNLVITLPLATLYILLGGIVAPLFKLSRINWIITVILTVLINWSILAESFLKGQKKFTKIGVFRLISAVLNFVIVLFVFWDKDLERRYFYYLIGLCIFHTVFVVLALMSSGLRNLKVSGKSMRMIYKYGVITMGIWVLTTILFSIDLFIVNYFCPEFDVGIYSIYQVKARNSFNIFFYEIFAVVFIPTIVSIDKVKLYRRKELKLVFPLAILATGILCVGLVWLFGQQNQLNWLYIFLVSLGIGIQSMYLLYISIISTEGNKGATICAIAMAIPLPLVLIMQTMAAKYYGIVGIMTAIVLSNLVLLIFFKIFFNLWCNKYGFWDSAVSGQGKTSGEYTNMGGV